MDGWDSETLSDAGLREFYEATQTRQKAAEQDRRERNTLGFCVGIGGMTASTLILAIALVLYMKIRPDPEPKYILVDKASGAIVPAVTAKDAPVLFPESTRRAEIRALIIACEGYVPQSWAKTDFHLCMIRLTSEEQKRRNLDIGIDGPRYPPKALGPAGYAMPTDFPLGAFVMLPTVGTPPNEIYHYAVRYERTEVSNGGERRARWSADVVFTFRPDLKIGPADALANPARMQVISFSTIRDNAP